MSASVRPSAFHCERRPAQFGVPGSKLLRSFRRMRCSNEGNKLNFHHDHESPAGSQQAQARGG
jgi:hypothetical protein